MKKADILTLFETFHRLNPDPKGELEWTTIYTLLVAVVLSAQATDKGVNKATRSLFQKVKTPQEMLNLGEEALLEHIKTVNFYPTKGRNIIKLSKLLVEKHKGDVPNDQQALEALPGVGRKTANVVRNIAFGVPTIAVDTHIFRISNRLKLATGKTPLDVEEKLNKAVPGKYRHHAHHWLILHGRYICTARNPKCGACPVYHVCPFKEKTPLPQCVPAKAS